MRFTPELMFMLPSAIFIDLCGLVLVIFGIDDFGIIDIIGILIFFPWLLLRGDSSPSIIDVREHMNAKKGMAGKIKTLFKDKKTKFLTPLLGELAPWIGGLGFFWTMSVIFNLEDKE
ncbi:MAG: hypothetical protein PHX92_02685 [Candidatus Pacebacteria bacterium]|nr:hypothetical protein [Candidatus Paceibacterota bacterium]